MVDMVTGTERSRLPACRRNFVIQSSLDFASIDRVGSSLRAIIGRLKSEKKLVKLCVSRQI
jgi:hypothetical protein